MSDEQVQWVAFAGGEDPDDCAVARYFDDEGEACDEAEWLCGGRVAKRAVHYGPWVVTPPQTEVTQ